MNTPHKDDKTIGMIKGLYDLSSYFDGSYVIDLYKYGPIYDEEFNEKFYMKEHLKPNGYFFTAKIIV